MSVVKTKKPPTMTERMYRWVTRRFKGKHKTTNHTAATLAKLASRELAFKVNANTMCRQLRKAGVRFKPSPEDPKTRNYSTIDLIKARLDLMEDRLKRVERKTS